MPRYAVLHDPHDAGRPVALLVESDTRVRLVSAERERVFDGDYVATEPDSGPLSLVTYRPGMRQYWDYVLLMLSRTYSVGEVNELPQLEKLDVLELYHEKIGAPASEPKPKRYIATVGASAVFVGFSRDESFRGRRPPCRPEPAHRRADDRRHVERHRTGGVPISA